MCVIDDIKTVVDGIANHIPWETYGIHIVGSANNGESGMNLIRKTQPHIVLADIRMPKMNGIEMMEQIVREYPDTKVIFLSGYTDFEYAQQAIRLGAFDYILKPFTPQKIIDVVLQAKAVIEEGRGKIERYREMERKLRASIPYLRQEYFQLLLRFPATPEVAAKRWDFLNIGLDRKRFIVMLAEIDRFSEQMLSLSVQEVELIRFTLHNILEETIGNVTKGLVFRDSTSRFVAVFNPPASQSAETLAEQCRENVEKFSKFTISVGLGEEVRHVHEISYSHTQALTALSYTFYTDGNSVCSYRNVRQVHHPVPRYSAEKEKELFYCLRSGNLLKSHMMIDELFSETMAADMPPPEAVKQMTYELAFLINRVFSEKLPAEQMEPLENQLQSIKNFSSHSLKDLQGKIKELCRMGCERIVKQQTEEANRVVEHVIAYIRQHLDANLTVNDYAKLVYLSGNYFANLFKKVTGTTIGQFVTTERMERAKTMLLEGMQVQEIAQALGYEDRPYFSELFKKHTGMTPSEFKQHYLR